MGTTRCAGVVLAAVILAAGCDSSHGATAVTVADATPAHALAVSSTSCAPSWRGSPAGARTYRIANRGNQVLQVSLINATTGAIFGEINQIDPGTVVPLVVNAPAGEYRFRCVPHRGVAGVSPVHRISGAGGSTATELVPLSAEEIDTAVLVYKHGVVRGVHRLVADTDRLTRDVRRGRLAAARAAWLPAHLDFAGLGAAYGTFGDLADRIDGRADGLPLGVDDPHFTGFLAVEHLLWHHASQAARVSAATTLDADVHKLDGRMRHLHLVAGDLPLRAHEILENALQFEMTGDTDEGSHTNLATVLANVHGTQLVIHALTPSIEQRKPRLLTSIDAGLTGFASDLRASRVHGRWPAITALPTAEHERLDADLDGLLEQLAELPGVLTLPASLALP